MTKEEILIEFGCPDIPFDENVTMYYPAILSAMDKYAEQEQAKTIAEHEQKINNMLKHPNVLTVLRCGVKSPSRCGLDDCCGVIELYDYACKLPKPYQEGGEG